MLPQDPHQFDGSDAAAGANREQVPKRARHDLVRVPESVRSSRLRSRGRGRLGVAMTLPIRDSYRVAELFLAGEYPGAADVTAARERIGRFESAGVLVFVDLTHPSDPLEAYGPLLQTGRRLAHPIVDMGTTTAGHMMRILDDVDAAIARDETVYVHCWGGIGRTGTVVGCWLMRHGLDEGDPIGRIAALRLRVLDSFMPSPQTTAQREMVLGWKRGR